LFFAAPVRQIQVQQVENRITCSSEGVYPEPELTWSTNPPSNQTLQNKTRVQQTAEQLYNISSSLIVSETDLDYSCTVSTHRNQKTATSFKQTSISSSDAETTIPCTSSKVSPTDLIWRFNHSQVVLHRSGADDRYTASEEWRQQVKSVSESGDLTLKDLTDKHEGIYSCERSDDEETYVTNTFLRLETRPGPGSPNVAGTVVGVIVALISLVIVCVTLYKCKHKKSKKTETRDRTDPSEGESLNKHQNDEENKL
ncbi:uncharacterized protein LOC121938109, partial [Plectropomus leopardus]|uniref:uncharacterized protein LOC121938109 n=1 Tax=Plectropomus leopardus TaxID=160734 RepID=UPI001C4CA085